MTRIASLAVAGLMLAAPLTANAAGLNRLNLRGVDLFSDRGHRIVENWINDQVEAACGHQLMLEPIEMYSVRASCARQVRAEAVAEVRAAMDRQARLDTPRRYAWR